MTFEKSLLLCVLVTFVWSAIAPHDRFTWVLEVAPGVIGLAVLLATRRSFPLTRVAYLVIAIHIVILCIGGHYTYAEVPAFDWLRDVLDRNRNDYDKVGHFWQGFGPAMVAREVFARKSPLHSGKWLTFTAWCFAMTVSAVYELLEWAVAIGTGAAAEAFLGTQGDPWDTQKDMFTCGLGAAMALLLLARIHDRQLLELEPGAAPPIG
jgi:putative membrane protein